LLYGVFRFFIEFFREPDQHIGLLYFEFSMGQILSLPMILIGLYFSIIFYNKVK
jgi:phosphatidylglycerol:prolipoprotein diacylglycerol transferase